MDEFRDSLATLEKQKAQITANQKEKQDAVDPNVGTKEQLKARMERIDADANARLDIIDERIAGLKERCQMEEKV